MLYYVAECTSSLLKTGDIFSGEQSAHTARLNGIGLMPIEENDLREHPSGGCIYRTFGSSGLPMSSTPYRHPAATILLSSENGYGFLYWLARVHCDSGRETTVELRLTNNNNSGINCGITQEGSSRRTINKTRLIGNRCRVAGSGSTLISLDLYGYGDRCSIMWLAVSFAQRAESWNLYDSP